MSSRQDLCFTHDSTTKPTWDDLPGSVHITSGIPLNSVKAQRRYRAVKKNKLSEFPLSIIWTLKGLVQTSMCEESPSWR